MPTPGLAEERIQNSEFRIQNGGRVDRPPILVLGLGNMLLGDDGIGLELLSGLSEARQWGNEVEFVDGGTQGLMLLREISGRPAVLILDAVDRAAKPGAVHVLWADDIATCAVPRSTTAHEGNAGELLAAATLLGESPGEVAVVGVQPERVATGIGLSETVKKGLRPALLHAQNILSEMIARCAHVSGCSG